MLHARVRTFDVIGTVENFLETPPSATPCAIGVRAGRWDPRCDHQPGREEKFISRMRSVAEKESLNHRMPSARKLKKWKKESPNHVCDSWPGRKAPRPRDSSRSCCALSVFIVVALFGLGGDAGGGSYVVDFIPDQSSDRRHKSLAAVGVWIRLKGRHVFITSGSSGVGHGWTLSYSAKQVCYLLSNFIRIWYTCIIPNNFDHFQRLPVVHVHPLFFSLCFNLLVHQVLVMSRRLPMVLSALLLIFIALSTLVAFR